MRRKVGSSTASPATEHDPAPATSAVAFFDMDRTLLTANSASLWLKFERGEGRLSRLDMARGLFWLLQYQLGVADMDTITKRALALSAGYDVAEIEARVERWYESMVRPTISRHATHCIAEHRAAGHEIAILTASTQFGASLLAKELEIDHLFCTRLEVDSAGRLTGRMEGSLCYGQEKLEQATAFAMARGMELSDAWFYSDSYSDLPLLETVGHPVAVNPDLRLARHARRCGWPIESFT